MQKLKTILLGAILSFIPFTVFAAQEIRVDETTAVKAMAGVAFALLAFMLIFVLTVYIYFAICFIKLAKKTNTENAWMAWIPILNAYLLVKISNKPDWWFLLMLIPFVNIVVSVIIWMEISKRLNKPEWLGILIIVPIANLILPGYLAFSKDETKEVQEPQAPTATI